MTRAACVELVRWFKTGPCPLESDFVSPQLLSAPRDRVLRSAPNSSLLTLNLPVDQVTFLPRTQEIPLLIVAVLTDYSKVYVVPGCKR